MKFFSNSVRPNRFWCPSSLLFNGHLDSVWGVNRPRREVYHSLAACAVAKSFTYFFIFIISHKKYNPQANVMIIQSTVRYHLVAKSEQSYTSISAPPTCLHRDGREGCDVTTFTDFHKCKLFCVILLKLLKYYTHFTVSNSVLAVHYLRQ
jgi:hypothetical protein